MNALLDADLVDACLVPDMLPLTFQIQTMCDAAKAVLVRVAGHAPFPLEADESTLEELQTRISKTVEVLEGAGDVAGLEEGVKRAAWIGGRTMRSPT